MNTPTRRSYDQQCSLAVALDVVGERWTLLIIRELLIGPRRYAQILEALPGIGTNLLADRLKYLTDVGVVRPVNPAQRRAGYELTELGAQLRESVLALARWGLLVMEREPAAPGASVRAQWAVLAIQALLDEDRAPDKDECYEFDVEGEMFHVEIESRKVTATPGPTDSAVLRISTDAPTFFEMGARRLDPIEALLAGRVRVEGAPDAVPRCLRLLGLGGDRAVPRAKIASAARR